MNNEKIGALICKLRKEQNMTQLQLAERMHISDRTVSKWERGAGCPDISLLSELSDIFHVDMEKLLMGELKERDVLAGNLKKMHFYVCPVCKNLITAMSKGDISCCGKKLEPLSLQKASEEEKLTVEVIENEYYVSSEHEMTREHFISFVALLTGDSLVLKKQYPQWNLQVRIPVFAHGMLIWHCTQHGLFYQVV